MRMPIKDSVTAFARASRGRRPPPIHRRFLGQPLAGANLLVGLPRLTGFFVICIGPYAGGVSSDTTLCVVRSRRERRARRIQRFVRHVYRGHMSHARKFGSISMSQRPSVPLDGLATCFDRLCRKATPIEATLPCVFVLKTTLQTTHLFL